MKEIKCIAAVLVNEKDQILPWIAASTKSSCEEEAAFRYGEELWERLKAIGCRVVQCEIKVLEE